MCLKCSFSGFCWFKSQYGQRCCYKGIFRCGLVVLDLRLMWEKLSVLEICLGLNFDMRIVKVGNSGREPVIKVLRLF